MKDITIATDRGGTKVLICSYADDSGKPVYDLMTDGRVLLTPFLARRIAAALTRFANGDRP